LGYFQFSSFVIHFDHKLDEVLIVGGDLCLHGQHGLVFPIQSMLEEGNFCLVVEVQLPNVP
jgi:hypothetical protein